MLLITMAVHQIIKRYISIISILRRRPMSYDEIQREITQDHSSIEEDLLTSQRTFQRDIKNIATIYDVFYAFMYYSNKWKK
ncbi:hypothetical protein ACKGJN_07380 [Gillisia sp. Q332]|uniref:hypothetical protein n=1 Tax=Gillisia xinjiangensis TaxID=3384765 RepID=UPI00391C0855